MYMPVRRWRFHVNQFFSSHKNLWAPVSILLLLVAIPLTVFVVQQQQEIRQRAQEQASVDSPAKISYPWDNPRSGQVIIPQVDAAKKAIFAEIPFSSKSCEKKSQGDADCNNRINLSDLSYWQIDYETKGKQYADFNGDGSVGLIDYNIWRLHANISPTGFVQELSKKLGLENILASLLWQFVPKISRVYAQGANFSTVTDSSVIIANDIYRVVNEFSDQTYSLQEIEKNTNAGQITYFDANGQSIAQITDFVQDNTTMTTTADNANVAVNRNPEGVVAQTSKDANGAFISSQVWPNTTAYTKNTTPQAATLPTAAGFATLSIQPNGAGILTQRDSSGKLFGESILGSDGIITNVNGATGMESIADGKTGLSISTVKTTDADITLMFRKRQLLSMMKRANDGSLSLAFFQSGTSWKFTTLYPDGTQTENTIANVTKQSDPNFPELSQILLTAKNFKAAKSYKNAGFYGAFLNAKTTAGQTIAANQIISVTQGFSASSENVSDELLDLLKIVLPYLSQQNPKVLGAQTSTDTNSRKEVLGDETNPADDPNTWSDLSRAAQRGVDNLEQSAAESRSGGQVQLANLQQQQAALGRELDASARNMYDMTLHPENYTDDQIAAQQTNLQNIGTQLQQNGAAIVNHERSNEAPAPAQQQQQSAPAAQSRSQQAAPAAGVGQSQTQSQSAAAPAAQQQAAAGGAGAAAQASSLSPQQQSAAAAAAAQQAVAALGSREVTNTNLNGITAGLAAQQAGLAAGMTAVEARNAAFEQAIAAIAAGTQGDRDAAMTALTTYMDRGESLQTSEAFSWGEVQSIVGDVSTVAGAQEAVSLAQASLEVQSGQYDGALQSLDAAVASLNAGTGSIEEVNQAVANLREERQDVEAAESTFSDAQNNFNDVSSAGGQESLDTGGGGQASASIDDGGGGGGGDNQLSSQDSYSQDNSQGSVDSNSNNGSY